MIRRRTHDITSLCSVIEALGSHMCEMAESVPLRSALSVHVVNVIVGNIFGKDLDLMLEDFTVKGWLLRDIQWKVDRHDVASPDLLCCQSYAGGCEEIESSDVVIIAPTPRGFFGSSWNVW